MLPVCDYTQVCWAFGLDLCKFVLAGNNDVFVTIQLGKEKYQTSTIKNAHNPEWFEECELCVPEPFPPSPVTGFACALPVKSHHCLLPVQSVHFSDITTV